MTSPTEAENLRIVETMIANGIRGNWDVVRGYIADDFECVQPKGLAYGGVYRGWDGYQELFAGLGAFWSDPAFGPSEFAATGDKVAVISTLRGVIKSTGAKIVQPLTEVWELRHGQVVRITACYYDTKEIADAAGG
jgi:ketosteroid isomerase-like protein